MQTLEDKLKYMAADRLERPSLLVLEDVEETASLIESMLIRDGYCVTLAKSEKDAIFRARLNAPNLILMSMGNEAGQLLAIADRIREGAGVGNEVAIVIFSVETIPEGAVIEAGSNTYLTRPDNFNQLREVLHRLLAKEAER